MCESNYLHIVVDIATAWYYRLITNTTEQTKPKNPAAVALGTLGGLAKSAAKTRAARENIMKRWAKVEPTFIYAFKLAGRFLYIGQSVDPATRHQFHTQASKLRQKLDGAQFVIVRKTTTADSFRIERQIIRSLKKRGEATLNRNDGCRFGSLVNTSNNRPESYKPEAGPGFGDGRHYASCDCWRGRECTCHRLNPSIKAFPVSQPKQTK